MTNKLRTILTPSAPSLNVLVIYDNLIAGIQAKDLCDRLTQHFRLTRPLKLNFWCMPALRFPLLARMAGDEAAETDLLLVAVNGRDTLPRSVQDWIRQTTRRLRSQAGAFVAQFHGFLPGTNQSSPACLQPIGHGESGPNFLTAPVNPFSEEPAVPARPLKIVPTWTHQCETRFRCSITFKRMD